MKRIAYVSDNMLGLKGNGIVSQALTWAKMLQEKGCTINLLTPWEGTEWDNIDTVHLFGSSSTWFYPVAKMLKGMGKEVVWSPICDNNESPSLQKCKSMLGCQRVGLYSLPYIRRLAYGVVDKVFVRSEYEKDYIIKSYGVDKSKMYIVPLSMTYSDNDVIDYGSKEPFCLHISSISQERKNVVRLIEAAKKYHFPLVLAGKKGLPHEYEKISRAIGDADNIKVLGFISEEEKISLYKRAKVFALPSICEGVGIVALDAAHFGCEVVITSIGGPKEYYGDMAQVVNPYDVDAIGQAVVKLLGSGTQSKLKAFVDDHYSNETIAQRLIECYEK